MLMSDLCPLFNCQERVVGPEAGVPDTAEALHGPSEAVSLSDQPEVSEFWHRTD